MYHMFFTANGIGHMISADGVYWRNINAVFPFPLKWWKEYVPSKTDFNIWAPNISEYKGTYLLFYSVSTFGSNTSCIGLATTKNLMEGKWQDKGLIINSTGSNFYNCIDPCFIEDGEKIYLSFGSFWNGIFITELDTETFLPKDSPQNIARRPVETAIEGPSIFKADNGWYYLICAYDFCCRGTQSTYNTRYGRAETITGPYLDENGVPLTKGGGTRLLSTKGSRIGPGGGEVFITKEGKPALALHYYDAAMNGTAQLLIKDLEFNQEGWIIH